MASLKEVKNRISSVKSTRQITSAMKMVASAKLHKAQGRIENMLPYQRKLNEILTNFLSTDVTVESPYTEERPVGRWQLWHSRPIHLYAALSTPTWQRSGAYTGRLPVAGQGEYPGVSRRQESGRSCKEIGI